MADEQAWLVRARSDSEGSTKLGSFGSIARAMAYNEDRLSTGTEVGGEPNNVSNMATSPPGLAADSNESGELLDYNDCSVLEQFHEDALRQAGCGFAQIRVVLAVMLAIAGSSLELAAIPFILPSAEIELCILPHEKQWLVLLSLVGAALGAAGWGVLGARLGRRRTLLSALAVNAVFAAVAAFMPTYGTFAMARFCSAFGSGGIVPIGCTYAGELCARARRPLALAGCVGAGGVGGLLAAALAAAVLPPTGPATLDENKEHFSAWHRYLLLCTLPILASLVSLIWTQESPRYLLDVGREVDAMLVYQSIACAHVRVCGAPAEPEQRLRELAPPAKRRPPALHHVRHSLKMFWQSLFQLFSGTYRNTTLSLGGTLLFTIAIQYYLSSYIPSTIQHMQSQQFEASKLRIDNQTFLNENYNSTLENVQYTGVWFNNCTFRDMLMSHVSFDNCSFSNVALSNIRTSYTVFRASSFVNCTIIDTDMEVGRELAASCALRGTVVRGMRVGCARHADMSSSLRGLLAEQSYAAHAALLAAAAALLPHRLRRTVALCLACLVLTPSLYVAESETTLYIIEAVYRLFITLIFFAVAIGVVDSYPANLRCTAHGLILSATYMGAALAHGVAGGRAVVACVVCGLLAAVAALAASRAR